LKKYEICFLGLHQVHMLNDFIVVFYDYPSTPFYILRNNYGL